MKSAEELAESIRSKLVGGGKGLTRKRVAAVAKVIKAAQEEARRDGYEAGYIDGELHGIGQATKCHEKQIADFARWKAIEECYRTVVQWGQRRALEMVKKLIDKEPKK